MKKLVAVVIAVVMLATIGGVATAANYQETGNGAMSGPHYTLNIIANSDKNAEMKDTKGHTIFVPLWGKTKIWLGEGDFEVTDRNGTDSDGAEFLLPNPDPDNDGTTEYTVFARALGQPGGKSFTTTCALDEYGEEWCSSITMKLERKNGKPVFQNVSKYLLYIYIDGNRYPLFDDAFEEYFWYYDNFGLRHAQLRFYETPTTVPDEVQEMSIDPTCLTRPQDDTTVTLSVSGPGNPVFDEELSATPADPVVSGHGITLESWSANGTDTMTIVIDISGSAKYEEKWIYATARLTNGPNAGELVTVNAQLLVDDDCL
jgi:hypothetical protein